MAIVAKDSTMNEVNEIDLSGTLSTNLPSDLAYGDIVILAYIGSGASAQFTGPSGWNVLLAPTAVPDASLMAAYYRTHTEASPITAAPTVTFTNAARHSLILQGYSGVNLANPFDVTLVSATASAVTSLAAPSVTTVTAGALLVSADLIDSSSAATTKPASMTLVKDVSGGSMGRGGAYAIEARPTAGATGTRTWTTPAALGMGVWMTALRPQTGLALSGVVTATGTLGKVAGKTFSGSSTPTGAWSYLKVVQKLFTGAVTASGTLARRTYKALAGSVATSGSLRKVSPRLFTGTAAPSGVFRKAMPRLFTGSVAATGALAASWLGRMAGRPGRALVRVLRSADVYVRVRRN